MRKIPEYYFYLALAAILVGVFFIWSNSPTPLNFATGVKHEPKTTTLFFGGDIMLSRNVAAKIYAANNNSLPFANIKDQISAASIAFANLESPFSDKGNHSVEGSLVFNADPKFITGLQDAGFDILSTANNHTLDQGQYGLNYTYNWLKTHNIIPIGTESSCHSGTIITKNNIRFGFLAYSYTAINNGKNTTDPSVCDANNLKKVAEDIENLRPKVDYLVVSTHMGVEYTRTPTDAQTAFAHNAVDSGADLVIGNHPHWIQPIEQYKGKWIFYAMGNLVFDQMWSVDTTQGLTATVTFKDKTLDSITVKPLIIENYCCPRWATDDETKTILGKINLTSTQVFSTIR